MKGQELLLGARTMKVAKIRCGLCDVVNDLLGEYEVKKGESFECGHCCGLSTVHAVTSSGAATRRRKPRESVSPFPHGGYVEEKAVALRDAWRGLLARP
jgi:hypothetical protein